MSTWTDKQWLAWAHDYLRRDGELEAEREAERDAEVQALAADMRKRREPILRRTDMSELSLEAAGIPRIPTHKDAPQELWIVTDKDGELARVCTSARDAETVRAYRQLDLQSLAPHFVTHYRKVAP